MEGDFDQDAGMTIEAGDDASAGAFSASSRVRSGDKVAMRPCAVNALAAPPSPEVGSTLGVQSRSGCEDLSCATYQHACCVIARVRRWLRSRHFYRKAEAWRTLCLALVGSHGHPPGF